MTLTLKRMFQTKTETIGKIVYDDRIICYTLEDVKREVKIKGETRIPQGYYKIEKRTEGTMIEKYRRLFGQDHYMLWLRDVPNFDLIMIHAGNSEEDTRGCVLTGTVYEEVNGKYHLYNSREAYRHLWGIVNTEFNKGNEVSLLILDEE